MKQKLSILLSLILFSNLLMFPGIFGTVASAAQPQMTVGYEQKLEEGKINSIPTKKIENISNSNAYIELDVDNRNNSSVSSGAFLLQYPLANSTIAQFRFDKSNDKAKVVYDTFNTTTPQTHSGYKIYTDSASPADGSSYFVHTHHGAVLGQPHYIKYSDFSNDGFSTGYYVDKSEVKPTFYINKGEGFSFKFENKTIQFVWNLSGTLTIYSDAFEQSKVFPARFFYSPSISAPAYDTPTQLKILTGISSSKITCEPISNAKGINDVLNSQANESPATSPNYMKVKVKVPEVWNDATMKFEIGTISADDIKFRLELENNITSQIQVSIDNIFNPVTSQVSGTTFYAPEDNAGVPTRISDASGDYIQFALGELPYGQIYEAIAKFIPKAGYAFNYTKVDFGKFYTFLKYSVSFIGDKYYAIIEPYKGYSGYYRLMVDGNKSVTSYNDGLNSIYMPLSLTSGSQNQYEYQVLFSPGVTFESGGNTIVESQKMNYKAGPESLTISIPNNFEILEHKYIPMDELSTDPNKEVKGTLKLDLRWEIGREATIAALVDKSTAKKAQIKYKLYSTTQPYAVNEDGTQDTSKIKLLTTVVMDIEREGASPNFRYKVTYSEERSTPSDPDILVFDEIDAVRYFTGAGSDSNDAVIHMDTGDIIYRAYVKLDTVAFNKNAITSPPLQASEIDFYFPNIYFMNVQPYELTIDGLATENLENTVGSSLYDSMTLDDYSKLQLPVPQNLTAFDAITTNVADVATEVSMKVKWTSAGEKIKEYFDKSFKYSYKDLRFNLYMSQSEKGLKPLTLIENTEDRIKFPVINIDFNEVYDSTEEAIYFSDINGVTAGKVNSEVLRYHLRQGSVICITDIPISIDTTILNKVLNGESYISEYKLDGLDKNQKYYFSLDMVANFYEENASAPPTPIFPDDYDFKKVANSMMTGIVTETTKADESKPLPEDKFPPAPELSKDEVSLSSAKILWNKITEPNAPDVTLEYEIIRLKDAPLESKLLDSRTDFTEFFNKAIKNNEKLGLKTDKSKIMEFNGTSFADASAEKYKYDSNTISLTDNTLLPNKLYFYYVRTVRMVNGKTLYSTWSDISVTTTPIKPPINLKVERAETEIKYDKQKEFVISFDAPLTDISSLGKDFEFEYSIKKDTGEWSPPFKMSSSELSATGRHSKSTQEGYLHFKYLVKNMYADSKWTELLSGSSYSIQVRIVDVINKDVSVYSNIAEARTELNQEEYDKDKETDEWLEYLKDELVKITKKYYWYAKKELDETIVIYRPEMFDELLTQSDGSALQLVKSDSYRTIYYLPASAVLSANATNKGFRLVNEDMEQLLSPNAFDTDYNEAFIDIKRLAKERSINDYYVKITVNKLVTHNYIEGYSPLSYQTTISLDTVGNKKNNKTFDNEILDMILKEVLEQAKMDKNIDKIKKMLEEKKTNEALVKYIDTIIEKVEKDLAKDVFSKLKNTLKSSYEIKTLNAAMIIRYINNEQGLVVHGFQATNGIWSLRNITSANGVHSISANTAGTFIFAGNKIYLPGIEKLEGSQDITNIIIKYGLDDYFGKDGAFKLDGNATTYMAQGISARLMGANKTEDPIAFLKSKGYTVSARNGAQAISKQEALYLLMSVYEVKTNTKIESVRITNYNLTANVKNLGSKYNQAVKVAFQIGIVSDKSMDAKSNITVKDFLEIILKLRDKAKL